MPHVIVKLWPGRTQQQKAELAEKISQAVKETICPDERSISVSFEDVASDKWMDEVYKPDILMKQDLLLVKPGYGAFEKDVD